MVAVQGWVGREWWGYRGWWLGGAGLDRGCRGGGGPGMDRYRVVGVQGWVGRGGG